VSGRVLAFDLLRMTDKGPSAMGVVGREEGWGKIFCGAARAMGGSRVAGVSDFFVAVSVVSSSRVFPLSSAFVDVTVLSALVVV
jgi:hypothetical protein